MDEPATYPTVLANSCGPMNGEPLQRKVTIINPQGFHLRPQSLFAQLAQQFQSDISVSNGPQRVNGKSQWDLMLLAAEAGTELTLEVAGADAPQALEILTAILAAASADDLPPPPPLPPKG